MAFTLLPKISGKLLSFKVEWGSGAYEMIISALCKDYCNRMDWTGLNRGRQTRQELRQVMMVA